MIERLTRGDEDAFEQIVRQYAGRLLAVARRILPEEEDARDAVQEAFLSAFRSIGSFRKGSRISTWLHRIVVNAALMRLRSEKRRPTEELEGLLPRFDDTGHQAEPSQPWSLEPEDEHLRAELRAWVRRAIDALPTRYRSVIMLRDIEELDTAEVAHLLNVSENTIKVRLHRARQALKTMLEPVMIAGGIPSWSGTRPRL